MIIQTAPAGEPRLAVMMYEHGELYKTDKQLPHELYARPLADNIPIGNVL
jgi:hypothetical protein